MEIFPERFSYLFEKYSTGKATPEEQTEFWAAIASFRDEDKMLIESLMQQWWDKRDMDDDHTINNIDSEKMLRRVFASGNNRVTRPRLRYWTAAAAVIFLFIAAGAYLNWQRQTAPHKGVLAATTHDLPAGSTAATLTLDDGSKIKLDSTHQGLLTRQGNALVRNKQEGLIYEGQPGGAVRYNILTTYKGEQYPVTLEDGTRILLDASSSLRFPVTFDAHERRVEITGRAWFEIAPVAGKPFYVINGDKKIVVLGTKFNVTAYNNENTTWITLVTGSIKVQTGKASQLLTPGQEAVIHNGTEQIQVNNQADVEETIAWVTGNITFHNADIATILHEIERWYDVQVIIKGTLPDKKYYFSVSRSASLVDALRFLEIYHIKYIINGENKTLTIQPA